MSFRSGILSVSIVAAAAAFASAQQPSLPLRQSRLDANAADPRYVIPLDSTVDQRWLGGGATVPRWDVDGTWAYFQFALDPKPIAARPDDPWWRISRDGRRIEQVDRKDALNVPFNVQYTRDGKRGVYFVRGELRYWRDGVAQPKVLLSRADAIVPRWSANEHDVLFTDGPALYAIDPESGALRQLTRPYVSKDTPKSTPLSEELKREQRELFDFVKKQRADSDTVAARARRDRAPMPIATPAKQTDQVSSVELSPDGKYVTYIVTPKVENANTVFSDFVNSSGVVEQKTSRPKVGETIAMRRAAIVPADPLADPDSVKVTYVDTTGFGKPALATGMLWNRQGTHLVVEFQSVDYKDLWTALVDPSTGKRIRLLDHEHDDAWLGGAGGTGGRHVPRWMTFLPDGETLAVTSERSGWAHLYLVDMQGQAKQITSGDWEIRSVSLSRDGTKWWLTTSKEHLDEVHLYAMPLLGGELTRVDRMGEGEARVALSPDEKSVAFLFASPRELDDIYLEPTIGAPAIRVTKAGTDAFYKIAWLPSDFVSFQDDQGKPVFARVYRPRTAHPNHPAVLEIHGAGYAQAVHKAFGNSSAHGGPLYAQYLAERGITYMVLDYRGSSGYGRDSRVAIYRDMGDRDVASAVSAIPFLAAKYQVDPKHVGLYGCSYGGFFTLMALFKHPGTFAAGAAQCSVTDWAHYNHSYTARILNGPPPADTAAYRTSSPIYWASGLHDRLLLQHGLVDNNVEYQDAARLVQRLMELHKDFEFVTYPTESHGWSQMPAKIDSQRRVTKLWEETILRSGTSVTQAGDRKR